jgi:hypothetical protein
MLAKFRTLEDANLPPPSPQRSGLATKKSTAAAVEREQPDGDEYEDVRDYERRREDEDERDESEELPEQGTTRNLLAKFQAMQT